MHNDFQSFPLINLFIQFREDQPPYTISELHCKLCFSQSDSDGSGDSYGSGDSDGFGGTDGSGSGDSYGSGDSDGSGGTDGSEETCHVQATHRETFFIMVSANEKYNNAILNITGGNLKSVKEIDNLITEDMIETTLGTFNTRMALINETHEKNIGLIMDTLNNITTRLGLLDMQGVYLSFINHFSGAL